MSRPSSFARPAVAAATAAALLAACADRDLTAPSAARPDAVTIAPSEAPALAVAATTVAPELPRTTMNTDWVEPTGRRLRVPAGGNLQAVIDSARGGDVILLQAGAVYRGNFRLRSKPAGSAWITIMTDTPLPAPGTRMTPARAATLAKLVAVTTEPTLFTRTGAHHYRIVGVEITAPTSITSMASAIVAFGYGGSPQTTLESTVHHLTLDRVYVHGHPTLNVKRCVALNSATSAVVDSYLSDCHSKTQDSQAIAGWNGPGPFKIVNNHLEGAGENIMFGGATPTIPNLIPSDIEIRGNHVFKPLAWKGVWLVKNLFELKCAQRVLLEGNVFENSWRDGQTGFAAVLKSDGPSSQSWMITQDVTMRYNVLRNVAGGVNIAANPNNSVQPARRIRLEHNLLTGVGTSNGTTTDRAFQVVDDLRDVALVHNTVIPNTSTGLVIIFDGSQGSNLTVKDNVWIKGQYGMVASGEPEGTAGLDHYWSSWTWANNVQVGFTASRYPSSNFAPSTVAGVGFVDYAGGDYRLAATSAYAGRASDGTNPGADVAAVLTRTAGAVVR